MPPSLSRDVPAVAEAGHGGPGGRPCRRILHLLLPPLLYHTIGIRVYLSSTDHKSIILLTFGEKAGNVLRVGQHESDGRQSG